MQRGAMQMPGILGRRIVVVSGGPQSARTAELVRSAATTPAHATIALQVRRSSTCIMLVLRAVASPRSRLRLAFHLVEEMPADQGAKRWRPPKHRTPRRLRRSRLLLGDLQACIAPYSFAEFEININLLHAPSWPLFAAP